MDVGLLLTEHVCVCVCVYTSVPDIGRDILIWSSDIGKKYLSGGGSPMNCLAQNALVDFMPIY